MQEKFNEKILKAKKKFSKHAKHSLIFLTCVLKHIVKIFANGKNFVSFFIMCAKIVMCFFLIREFFCKMLELF